jgi:hypothetical protein
MPDPVSGTGQARSGIQNVLNLLDSGFRRNDGKEIFSIFYESIKIPNLLIFHYSEVNLVGTHFMGGRWVFPVHLLLPRPGIH